MKIFKSDIKLNRKYIGFFSVVPLLLLTAVIKVPCPICDGTGQISSDGMGTVSIINIDYSLQSVSDYDNACQVWHLYTYNIVLTLQNSSATQDAQGYIELGVIDTATGLVLGEQDVLATVPASQEVQNFFTTIFQLNDSITSGAQIEALVEKNNQTCKVCGGTGKVALNAWLVAELEKQQLSKIQQVSVVPVILPTTTLSPEEDIGQEYSTDQWIQEHPDETDVPQD